MRPPQCLAYIGSWQQQRQLMSSALTWGLSVLLLQVGPAWLAVSVLCQGCRHLCSPVAELLATQCPIFATGEPATFIAERTERPALWLRSCALLLYL